MGKTRLLSAALLGVCLNPSTAIGQGGDDFVYVECDITSQIFDGGDQKIYRWTEYYRFSESMNEVGNYRVEYNRYVTECVFYECNVGPSSVVMTKIQDENTSWEKSINRMTGAFGGLNRINTHLPDSTTAILTGTCSPSQSKVVRTRRF